MPHAKVNNVKELRHWAKVSKARRIKNAKRRKK